jgi:hypothetical protein
MTVTNFFLMVSAAFLFIMCLFEFSMWIGPTPLAYAIGALSVIVIQLAIKTYKEFKNR